MQNQSSNNYQPSEDEEFMGTAQLMYFKAKLEKWKKEILQEHEVTLSSLRTVTISHPDLVDCASSEEEWNVELRKRDRQRKLLSKIDAALQRIQDGTYGFCEETGNPIGLRRLEARPVATLSVEAQERRERLERMFKHSS